MNRREVLASACLAPIMPVVGSLCGSLPDGKTPEVESTTDCIWLTASQRDHHLLSQIGFKEKARRIQHFTTQDYWNVHYQMPIGWTFCKESYSVEPDAVFTSLYDGRNPGSRFCLISGGVCAPFGSLHTRYLVSAVPTEYEVKDTNDHFVVIHKGRSHLKDDWEGWDEFDARRTISRKLGEQWLNEHYPDWRNPLAYWD